MDDPVPTPTPTPEPQSSGEPAVPAAEAPKPEVSIPIEETPEIVPIPVQVPTGEATLPPPPSLMPPKRFGSSIHTLGTMSIFVVLFIVGIWLSSFLRQFVPTGAGDTTPTPTSSVQTTPSPDGSAPPLAPADLYASWKTYEVISGVTKLPIAGVTYKLPSEVLSPICDSAGCASQGTYLPGGTRFTVAPRGAGQALRDFRGTVISDVNGTAFTTQKVLVAGLPATEFTGVFIGRTASGYVFSRMRGVMIPLSDTLSLEINHFTPNGITADFEKDEVLFDTILKTIIVTGEKGAILLAPSITQAPTSTPTSVLSPTKIPTPTGY